MHNTPNIVTYINVDFVNNDVTNIEILNNVNTNFNFNQTYRIRQRRSYRRDRVARRNSENETRENEPREMHYPYRTNNVTITRTSVGI
jgi:hypothetical protein